MAHRTRRFRYSLLALLVLTTIAACAMGVANRWGGGALVVASMLFLAPLLLLPWVLFSWLDDVRFRKRARRAALPPRLEGGRDEASAAGEAERQPPGDADRGRLPRRRASAWVKRARSVFVRYKYD